MDRLKDWWRRVRPRLVSGLVYGYVNVTGRTLRIATENLEAVENFEGPKIICGWHGKLFVAASYWRGKGVWVIISQSRDGEIQTNIFTRLGYRIIRGSTGRGGVRAAVEGIRALKEGGMMAITPDGPRGPSGIVQGGVMLMAQKSGAALIPVGISAKPSKRAKSWDRYMVQLPLARGLMVFGEPILVPRDASEDEVEQARLELETEIHRLEKIAEERMAR